MITLAPLPRSQVDRVLHLELGTDQLDFVGQVEEMVGRDDPMEDFHCVERDGTVVGFFKLDRGYPANYAFALPGELGVRGVVIDRQVQGQGIGAATMSALPEYARVHYPEASGLVLTVNCNNPAGQWVYMKAGFHKEQDLYLGGRAGPQHILRMPLR